MMVINREEKIVLIKKYMRKYKVNRKVAWKLVDENYHYEFDDCDPEVVKRW